VNHPEYMYLIARAHALRDEADEAEAEGDDFLPANHFVPLSMGGAAQARIDRTDEGIKHFVLTLRGCTDPDRIAVGFFATSDFERLGPNPKGDWEYRTATVPAPLRSPKDRDAPTHPDPDAPPQSATKR
jgi:hypothetical protein